MILRSLAEATNEVGIAENTALKVSVAHDFLPKQMSLRASAVMDHFGVGFETGRHVIAEDLKLPIRPGDVVSFTGESGSGKSSLMRAAASQLPGVVDIDRLELGESILVEGLGESFNDAARLLSLCGLGEAHLMLRRPSELSDGQRYRFRLARALGQRPRWIMADEFTATLDRTLAKVIAFNLARHARTSKTGFLLATTHEDILADLQPTLHVRCALDGPPLVSRHERKKKASVSAASCGYHPGARPTCRTSLGGQISHTASS